MHNGPWKKQGCFKPGKKSLALRHRSWKMAGILLNKRIWYQKLLINQAEKRCMVRTHNYYPLVQWANSCNEQYRDQFVKNYVHMMWSKENILLLKHAIIYKTTATGSCKAKACTNVCKDIEFGCQLAPGANLQRECKVVDSAEQMRLEHCQGREDLLKSGQSGSALTFYQPMEGVVSKCPRLQ